MVRIDGHNRQNRQNKKTTLADRRKKPNHKPLEVGQTLSQPTGAKLRQQPIVVLEQQVPLPLLNQQNPIGGTGGTIIIGGEPQTKGIFPSANPEEYAKSLEKAEKSRIYPNRDPKIYAEQLEKSTPGLKLKPEGGKSSKGFWGKIFKSKGGKIGAGVALTGALVYGAYKLFGGDDNKNAEVKQNNPVQEQKATAPADTTATQKETPVAEEAKPEVKSETNTEAKPVVTPVPVAENDSIAKADVATEVEKADDAKAVVAKPETEETEEAEKTEKTEEAKEAKEAEEAKKAEEEFNEWIAQKGENYWKYAKQELIFEHQGQAGYKPTNKEISERMLKIMERNGVKFANDGIHSDPMLKIGDKVKVKFGTEEKAA